MKEKIIILSIIVFFIFAIRAWATPTFINCGNATEDSACSDGACRIQFDNTTAVSNCEVQFASPETAGYQTFCFTSNPAQARAQINANFNSLNIYPVAPLTSLQGTTVYFICDHYTQQER